MTSTFVGSFVRRAFAARFLHIISLVLAVAISSSQASAEVLTLAAGTGIRDFGSGPFLLDFMAVKKATEDRTALEYDLSGLSGPVPSATLDIWLDDIDEDDGQGILDVFPYIGNGSIEPADFFAGAFFNGFNLDAVSGLVHLDVTAAVNDALLGGTQILGFRLSTDQDSRFNIGSLIGLPDPTLTVVPEPSGLILAVAALSLFPLTRVVRRSRYSAR
jgi:hypothetical protein